MNVLMTADAVGGVWSYALELADALAELDVAVTLAITGAPLSAEQRVELRRSQVARCFAAGYALEWQQDWTSFRRSCDWLREIAETVDPDIVHVNGFAQAVLGWRHPVVVVAHSCVSSWFEAVRGRQPPPEWDRYRREVASGLAAADLVVAPTRAMLDALRRHHPFECESRVIANGIGVVERSSVPKRRVVLAAGRLWDEAKNVGALARVAAFVDAPIEVAGDLGGAAPETVHALGRLGRDELRARMAASAVFCAPARYEPFGLAPLEAAAAGCALVLGDIGSLREVWEDAALFVEPDDPERLIAALTAALEDHVALGARALRQAARYTSARMAEEYADAYERLVTERITAPADARA